MSSKSNIHVFALSLGLCILFSMVAVGQVAGTAAGSTSASSSGPAPAASVKVGIVRMLNAIFSTDEGKKELEAMQARFGPRENELKAQQDELEKLQADLQVKGDKLSEEERNNRIKVATEKQKALQRNGEDYQAEAQQAQEEVLNRLGKKMRDVMAKYAQDNSFAVILDVSNQGPVMWASPTTDISKELVDAYNAAYPVAASPAKPGGTTPTRPAGAGTRPPAAPATPKKPQ
ncbi:MAG TPA: OmpH family outer membrane protein [Candidatus Angelobacter sp.]|jgi:outer membrane protein|nr:OmpH family outer membrane protein [Candidatus Angelobacter sp.]